MPEISRFFGIVIAMYYADHGPPHFHAHYGSATAQIGLSPVSVMDSDLPPGTLRLALEWANLHERELLQNWQLVRSGNTPSRIAPLE